MLSWRPKAYAQREFCLAKVRHKGMDSPPLKSGTDWRFRAGDTKKNSINRTVVANNIIDLVCRRKIRLHRMCFSSFLYRIKKRLHSGRKNDVAGTRSVTTRLIKTHSSGAVPKKLSHWVEAASWFDRLVINLRSLGRFLTIKSGATSDRSGRILFRVRQLGEGSYSGWSKGFELWCILDFSNFSTVSTSSIL